MEINYVSVSFVRCFAFLTREMFLKVMERGQVANNTFEKKFQSRNFFFPPSSLLQKNEKLHSWSSYNEKEKKSFSFHVSPQGTRSLSH